MSKMERPFDEELKLLKEKLLEMAARAEEQIALAVRGLKDREEKLACRVLEREEAINLLDIPPRYHLDRDGFLFRFHRQVNTVSLPAGDAMNPSLFIYNDNTAKEKGNPLQGSSVRISISPA